jgi:hypothetical protein
MPCAKPLPCVFLAVTVMFSLPCAFSQTYTAKSFLPCSAVFDTRQMLTNTAKNIFPVVLVELSRSKYVTDMLITLKYTREIIGHDRRSRGRVDKELDSRRANGRIVDDADSTC